MTTPTMIPTITMVERKPLVVGVVDWDGVGEVKVGVVEDMSVVGVGVTEEVEDGEGKSNDKLKGKN